MWKYKPLDINKTFDEQNITHGSVIVFQQELTESEDGKELSISSLIEHSDSKENEALVTIQNYDPLDSHQEVFIIIYFIFWYFFKA